jgi:hypothetical protein
LYPKPYCACGICRSQGHHRDRGERAKEIRSGPQAIRKIKIGNIMLYCGPASAYGVIGNAEAAYFNKGTISTAYLKDPIDPVWKDDPWINTGAKDFSRSNRCS